VHLVDGPCRSLRTESNLRQKLREHGMGVRSHEARHAWADSAVARPWSSGSKDHDLGLRSGSWKASSANSEQISIHGPHDSGCSRAPQRS